MGDYLDSVREIERRVNQLRASQEAMADLPNAPPGATDDFGELLDVQFEMMALALDSVVMLYGSNMANSDRHNSDLLPSSLVGKGGGIKGGQHLHLPQDTPHSNLLLTMLNRVGVKQEKFMDSTGVLAQV